MYAVNIWFVLVCAAVLPYYATRSFAPKVDFMNRNPVCYLKHVSHLHQDRVQMMDEVHPSLDCHTCDYCKTEFRSRNKLFRHLRTDQCTATNPRSPSENPSDLIVKQSIAIQFAYFAGKYHNSSAATNEWAGTKVVEDLERAIAAYNGNQAKRKTRPSQTLFDFRLQKSRTQSSVASLRSSILQQDPHSSAIGDVIIVTGTCLESALPHLEKVLQLLPYGQSLPHRKGAEKQHDKSYQIICTKLLKGATIHAERSCTQMAYQYLLPLSWMPDAERLRTGWRGWTEKPPTDSLRKLKRALRLAESPMLSNYEENEKRVGFPRSASGRFGRLAAKERRAWHNFASPELRGKASPNHESVWRCVDFCRIVGMVNFGQADANLIIEIRGDSFLPTQVRRIIGTALAIVHGWLPESALSKESLLSPLYVCGSILAPDGRQYLSSCRFHFEESKAFGEQFFDTDVGGTVVGASDNEKVIEWLQTQIVQTDLDEDVVSASWLDDVRKIQAPRILETLNIQRGAPIKPFEINRDTLMPTPDLYQRVLGELRAIVQDKKWPEVSAARSTVIRQDRLQIRHGAAGSFTLVNPKALKVESTSNMTFPMPSANRLFPELVESIFQLEESICEDAKRVQEIGGELIETQHATGEKRRSTHCAVNADAQFTPHVDSGRGAGQSMSLIVGLGDYEHGELLVEGNSYSIRYSPLEFDGWSLRHWTNHYVGERFSLVWFTPEI